MGKLTTTNPGVKGKVGNPGKGPKINPEWNQDPVQGQVHFMLLAIRLQIPRQDAMWFQPPHVIRCIAKLAN